MPHDAKGVYNAFKERNINYASADSRVVNADQVSKLLRLLRHADEANVIPELQQMPYVNGQVTWCGRWSLATRLLGYADDSREFRCVIKSLAAAFAGKMSLRSPVAELTKDGVVDAAQALILNQRVMAKVVEECSFGSGEPKAQD